MNKDKMIDRVLENLGSPQIKVELSDAQLSNAIEVAIYQYKKLAVGKATEESYFNVPISAGVAEYILPEIVHSVVETTTSPTGSNDSLWDETGFSPRYDIIGYSPMAFTGSGSTIRDLDLIDIHLFDNFMDTFEQMKADKYKINYHDLENKIVIYPVPEEEFFVLLKIFANVNVELLYDQLWVQDFATAQAKLRLGHIYGKYQGITLPGGGTISGRELIQEANEDINELKENIEEDMNEGIGIMFG